MSFMGTLVSAGENIALSYGYTLAVWSAGMLAITRYGNPGVRHLLLFLVGAVGAYSIFTEAAVWYTLARGLPIPSRTSVKPVLNVLSLVSAIARAQVTNEAGNRDLGYLTTGFTTTTTYILSLSIFVWLYGGQI